MPNFMPFLLARVAARNAGASSERASRIALVASLALPNAPALTDVAIARAVGRRETFPAPDQSATVPDLSKAKSAREVKERIRHAHLKAHVQEIPTTAEELRRVLIQEPRPGAPAAIDSEVIVIVGTPA
jgi:hypothetical protein